MWCAYWLLTMQIGHSRLQWSVTSMIGRQVCCSWSSQVPQSVGQPCSTWRRELQRLGAGAREGVGADVVARVLGDQRLRRPAGRAGLLEVDAGRRGSRRRRGSARGRSGRSTSCLEQVVAGRVRRDVAAREERRHPGRRVGRDLSSSVGPQRRAMLEHARRRRRAARRAPRVAAPQPPQVVCSWAKNVWGLSRRPEGGTQVVHSMAIPPTTTTTTTQRRGRSTHITEPVVAWRIACATSSSTASRRWSRPRARAASSASRCPTTSSPTTSPGTR